VPSDERYLTAAPDAFAFRSFESGSAAGQPARPHAGCISARLVGFALLHCGFTAFVFADRCFSKVHQRSLRIDRVTKAIERTHDGGHRDHQDRGDYNWVAALF